MVCSMTGFGRSEYLDDEKKIIIVIKSVNHRYCDINVKLPRTISRFEPEIRKRLKLYAERGKIDVFILTEEKIGKENLSFFMVGTIALLLDIAWIVVSLKHGKSGRKILIKIVL